MQEGPAAMAGIDGIDHRLPIRMVTTRQDQTARVVAKILHHLGIQLPVVDRTIEAHQQPADRTEVWHCVEPSCQAPCHMHGAAIVTCVGVQQAFSMLDEFLPVARNVVARVPSGDHVFHGRNNWLSARHQRSVCHVSSSSPCVGTGPQCRTIRDARLPWRNNCSRVACCLMVSAAWIS